MSKKSRTKSEMGANTCQTSKAQNPLAQKPAQSVAMSSTSGKAQKKNKKRAANRRAKKQGLATDTSNTHQTPHTPATMSNGLLPAMNGLQVSDFHCKVTKLSATEVQKGNEAFLRKVDAKNRPNEKDYRSGACGVNHGNYTYSKPLVQVIVLLHDANLDQILTSLSRPWPQRSTNTLKLHSTEILRCFSLSHPCSSTWPFYWRLTGLNPWRA